MGVVIKKGGFNLDCLVCCKNDFLNCKNDFLNCKKDFLKFS